MRRRVENAREFSVHRGMNDGQVEDMNATPLSKLPPPVMQTKQGQAPVEPPSYRDLLTEMESAPHAQPQPMSSSQPPPPPPPPQYAPPQYAQPQYAQSQYAQPQWPPTPPPRAYDPYYDLPDPAHTPPAAALSDAPLAAAEEGTLKRLVKANKSTLVVLGVVLLTLLFVLPRLARMPRFVGLDGQLSLLGKGAAAAIAALAYRLTLLVV